MSIQHVYSQTIADGTATSVVRPSDWNSNHNMVLNLGGNTLGTQQVSGQDIVWAGGNNVTLSANGSTVSIVGAATVAQTVQTQASGNIAGAGFTSTTVAGSVVAATHNSAGLLMAVPAYLTTAAQSNHSHNFATTTTGGSNIVVGTANSVGATIGVPSFLTTAALSQNTSNYAGIGTTFAGTNATATLAANTNGVALSLSVAGGGVVNQTGPNIAVAGQTVTAGTVYFSNSPTVTFGMDGASNITASAAGGGGAGYTQNLFQPEIYGATVMSTLSTGTVYFRPFEPSNYIDVDRFMFQQSLASLTSTRSLSGGASGVLNIGATGSWGMTGTVALFSRVNTNETNASFNSIASFYSRSYSIGAGYTLSQSQSTNVSSATVSYSSTAAVSFVGPIDSTGGFTTTFQSTSTTGSFSSTSTGAGTFGSSIVMAAPYSYLSGLRPLWVPGPGSNMPPGEYWIGYQYNTTTGSTGSYSLHAVAQMSLPGQLFFTASTNNFLEIGNSVPFTTSNWRLGFGSLSASSLTTGAIGLSQISNMASNASQYFAIYGHTK